MTTPVSLIRVGNSNAIIIPSKILKQMSIKENSKFELSLEEDFTLKIRKVSSKDNLVFPKIARPSFSISKKEMKEFFEELIVPDSSEIEKDERMAYILGK